MLFRSLRRLSWRTNGPRRSRRCTRRCWEARGRGLQICTIEPHNAYFWIASVLRIHCEESVRTDTSRRGQRRGTPLPFRPLPLHPERDGKGQVEASPSPCSSPSSSADSCVCRLVIVKLLSSAKTGFSYIAKRPRTAETKLAFMKEIGRAHV